MSPVPSPIEAFVVYHPSQRTRLGSGIMTDMDDPDGFAALPRIDDLVARSEALVESYGRRATTDALRSAVAAARSALRAGDRPDTAPDALVAAAAADLAARRPGPPRAVVNATGVVVHTNLGRAPLSEAAVAAVDAAAGYCDLEMDLEGGGRGSRDARPAALLAEACDAEAAFAVNNAAAALVLGLAALAAGRQVLVSRGELVEIGGSFRLPDIMGASGARLVEVGTTNRTRASDFATTGDDVAMILAVHPSNYAIEGFTEAPTLSELRAVAAERRVPLVYDAGSGLLTDDDAPWSAAEPSMAGSLRDGADLVLASGDKLLGGPQAGLLAGRADLVDRCRRHPLARALRLDKLRIAALVRTLEAHLSGRRRSLPVWAMLEADPASLLRRAELLAGRVGGTVVEGASLVGGGAAPGREIPSPVVRLDAADVVLLARRLRLGEPPVVVRVDAGAVWLDLRTVDPADDDLLAERVAATLG
jgi:L-seryl-tRNA(Ser) seleniumtransferase